MRKLRLILVLYVALDFLAGYAGFFPLTELQAAAQQPPVPITTAQITMPVFNTNPSPATGAALAVVGNPGPRTDYYWISANYLVGKAALAGPFLITNAPNQRSVSNYVTVNPSFADTSVLTYDVLRTITPIQPSGACACAVATGVSVGTVTNDQSGALGAYTVNAFNISTLTISLQNEVQSAGVSHLILRQNGVFVADLNIGGGGGSGTVTSIGLLGTANQIIVAGASPITASGSWTLSAANPFTLPSNGSVGALSLGCGGSDQPVGSGVAWVAPVGCTPYNLIPPATSGSGFFRGSNSANKVTFLFQNSIDLSADVGTSICPIANGCTGNSTASGALINLFPTPTRPGDLIYWNGSAWNNFGGNSGTPGYFTENSGGAPGWVQIPIPVIHGGTGLTAMTLGTLYKGNATSGILPSNITESGLFDSLTGLNINTAGSITNNARLNVQSQLASVVANFVANQNTAQGVEVDLWGARGTSASPTATLSGDILGQIGLGGWTGSAYSPGVNLIATAGENWSPTANGAGYCFVTIPNGSTVGAHTFCQTSNGKVGIGLQTPAALFTISNGGALAWDDGSGSNVITGVSSGAAGEVDIGNGTQANKSGTLKAANVNASSSISTGTAPAVCGTATGCYGATEGTAANMTPTLNQDGCTWDSATHTEKCTLNNGAITATSRVLQDGNAAHFLNGTGGWTTPASAGLSYWALPLYTNNTQTFTANQLYLNAVSGVPALSGINHLQFNVSTADTTGGANNSAVCIYNADGTLAVHTAPANYNTTGFKTVATVETNGSVKAGKVYYGFTSVTGTIVLNASGPGPMSLYITGAFVATSGGACPASISPPADIPVYQIIVPMIGFGP